MQHYLSLHLTGKKKKIRHGGIWSFLEIHLIMTRDPTILRICHENLYFIWTNNVTVFSKPSFCQTWCHRLVVFKYYKTSLMLVPFVIGGYEIQKEINDIEFSYKYMWYYSFLKAFSVFNFLSTWHKWESSVKRELQQRKHLHQIGLQESLWNFFFY